MHLFISTTVSTGKSCNSNDKKTNIDVFGMLVCNLFSFLKYARVRVCMCVCVIIRMLAYNYNFLDDLT